MPRRTVDSRRDSTLTGDVNGFSVHGVMEEESGSEEDDTADGSVNEEEMKKAKGQLRHDQEKDLRRRAIASKEQDKKMVENTRQSLADAVDRMQGLVQNAEWQEAYKLLKYAKATLDLLEHTSSALPKWVTQDLPQLQAQVMKNTGSHGGITLKTLWELAGWNEPRRLRPYWSSRMETTEKILPKPRNKIQTEAVLQGAVGMIEGDNPMKMIRFLLSSTFTDTVVERNLILDDVAPFLQEYARRRGFEYVTAEMRWGIRAGAADEHLTSDICMQELDRCIRDSAGINYVLILGQKYGFRPFPSKIERKEFDGLVSKISDAEDHNMVKGAFLLDTNALDEEYVLQSIDQSGAKFRRMQVLLRQAALALWPDGREHLRDPLSKHRIKYYFWSVTEEEVTKGLLWRPDRGHKTFVFKREIEGIVDVVKNPERGPDEKPGAFIDIVDDHTLDEEALELIKNQQQHLIPTVLPRERIIAYPPIHWGPGIKPETHGEYLRKFADDFCQLFVDNIDHAVREAHFEPDPVVDEAREHLRFAKVRQQSYTPTESAMRCVAAINDYVDFDQSHHQKKRGGLNTSRPTPTHGKAKGHCFVLWGRSGVGKTYVMSEAVVRASDVMVERRGVVVVRFLGTTPNSGNCDALLKSLNAQLHRLYVQDRKPYNPPADFKDLCNDFRNKIALASENRPLVLFLDSLDQLEDTTFGRRLEWLPVNDTPPHVRLVLSTLPDDGESIQILSWLRRRMQSVPDNLVEAKPIKRESGLNVLMHILRKRRRGVTEAQQSAIMDAFDKVGTPLWLTIAAQWASSWHSYTEMPEIRTTVTGLIFQLFDRLERYHGRYLVSASLGYITVAKNGISETELQEALSLEDDALADSYEWWVPPTRVMPPLLPTRVLSDLQPYLSRRGDGSGFSLVCWYHRQFWETAEACYVPEQKVRIKRHREMRDYFSGKWAGTKKPYNLWLAERVQRPGFFPTETEGDRHVTFQPLVLQGQLGTPGAMINTRRVHELMHHLIGAHDEDFAVSELCSVEYIAAKFQSGAGAMLLAELAAARLSFPNSALAVGQVKSFIGRRLDRLLSPAAPNATFQLAIQEPDKSVPSRHAQMVAPELLRYVIRWINKPQDLEPCILTISEHEGRVNQVCWSPDGLLLASVSDDCSVKICNSSTGEEFCTLKGHRDPVTSVAFMSDGNTLVSGSWDKTLRLWDVKLSKETQFPITGHTATINVAAFSKDGIMLASAAGSPGHADYTIRLWLTATGQPIGTPLIGHTGSVFTVVFDASGNKLASGGADCTIRLWSTRSCAQLLLFDQLHTGSVMSLSYSPNGMQIASASLDGTIIIWDASNGKLMFGPTLAHSNGVRSVAFAPLGSMLASGGGDNMIKVWTPVKGSPLGRHVELPGHKFPVSTVAFSPDSTTIASGGDDSTVRLWDATLAIADGKDEVPSQSSVALPRLGSDSFTRTTSNFNTTEDNRRLSMNFGDAKTPEIKTGMPLTKEELQQISVGAGAVQSSQQLVENCLCIAFSPCGKLLASASGTVFGKGSADVIEFRNPEDATLTGQEFEGHQRAIAALAFSPNSKMIASGSWDKTVRMWNVDDQSVQLEASLMRGHEGVVSDVAFSPDGQTVASVSEDRSLRLWNTVRAVTYSPSGKIIASGSDDRTVVLWDAESCRVLGDKPLMGHRAGVTSLSISPDGMILASASWDHSILLWDLDRSHGSLGQLYGHTGPVQGLHFATTHTLLSVADDSTLRVWDLRVSNVCVSAFLCDSLCKQYAPLPLKCVHSTSSGKIAAGGEKGLVYRLDASWIKEEDDF